MITRTSGFASWARVWAEVIGRFMPRGRETHPIDTEAELCRFVATRASLVAQKTLYGYLRTRIGTRYPEAFREPDFARSIDIAKLHVYAACLSDLSIHAIARALADPRVDDESRRALATASLRSGLDDNARSFVESFSREDAETAHQARLAAVDWTRAATGRESFGTSPAALVRWAPIAPELKRHDEEIVENSMRFAWQEIRADLERRLDAGAITAELLGRAA